MKRSAKRSADLAHIRQLCCLGLGGQAIMPALLHALHKIVPSYANVFLYADEEYRLTNLYAESPVPPAIIQRYLSEFHNKRELEVIPSFAETLRSGAWVGNFRSISAEKFYRSDLYNVILRPCHLHHGLDGVIREDGRTFGIMLLFRAPGGAPFTPSEGYRLAALIPHIAHGLNARPDFHGAFTNSGEEGLIIFNGQGKISFIDPQARRLLFLSTHPRIAPGTVERKDDEIPPALLHLVHSLRTLFMGQAAAPPVVHHQNPWGKFVFHAYWLEQNDYSGSALIGVTVQRQEPLPLRLLRTMQFLPLSTKQREVCLSLTQGHTHATIAQHMGVSLSTAIDYVRVIYDKLEVHSHEALLQKLLAEPGSPDRPL